MNYVKPDRSKLRSLMAATLAGALTVVLYSLCFPPFNLPYLAWIAPAPLLVVIPRLSLRGTEWFGFLTGYALYAINFRWLYAIFGFPAVALWGLLALFMAVFCVLVRSLPVQYGLGRRLLLIPCFWVAVEYVRCEQWPLRFSWLAMGYSQHNDAVVLPVAGYVGVYGLSFLILMLAVYVAKAWSERWWIATAFAFLWIAVMLPGSGRAGSRNGGPTAATGRVVLVQSNSHSVRDLIQMSERAPMASGVPTLVVWPEYVLQNTDQEDPEAYTRIRNWAAKRGVTLVFGGMTSCGEAEYCSAAYVVGPAGQSLGVYEKHNPLPFFKDGQPGTSYPVYPWQVGAETVPFGATICFDLSFERNARLLARNGARFIVVPSVEPSDWPRLEQAQHAMIAPLRAVENGVGILRCSAPGPSQVVSMSGWVWNSMESGKEGLIVDRPYPGSGRRTMYNRFGWLFPYLCQVITAGWILRLMYRALRGRRRTVPGG